MAKNRRDRADEMVEALDATLNDLGYDDAEQVRTFHLSDGREVILIQANAFSLSRLYVSGRPDGTTVNGWDSCFSMIGARLTEYREQHGTDLGFSVSEEEWSELFDEARDRYVRYLFFSGIQRWGDVDRDTRMNLTLCDWALRYSDEQTAWEVYKYKGYILMMNTIAQAEMAFADGNVDEAQKRITRGIEQIGAYCRECLLAGRPDAEQVTRGHYLANILKYREDAVMDGKLPNVARNDPRNVV